MTQVHEFRVRPVNRFVLTEYRKGGTENSVSTIAELPNADLANELGRALQRAHPGSTLTDSEGARFEANYPARFGLDAEVWRAATAISQTGVGQHGILHSYPAEKAVVVGVHFYPGKVCYDVTFPSGRRGETVDSVELSDLSTTP